MVGRKIMNSMAALLIGCVGVSQADDRPGIEWWITHSLDKTFPDSVKPETASQAIELKAARNETEDAQVIVRIPAGTRIARAAYVLTDLTGPKGAMLSKDNLAAWWVWYIYVLNNPRQNTDPSSYLRKAPAFFPDAFLEQPVIRIRDEWTQPLWFSARVPEGTPPGKYSGRINIELTDDEGAVYSFEVPVSLTVWRFTLPQVPTLHHTEWFLWSFDYYRVKLWSDEHWQWIEKAARDMARHKQDTILTPFFSLVDVYQDGDGLGYDFARLDRWLDVFQNAGVTWIEGCHVAGRSAGWESDFVWARFPIMGADGRPLDVSAGALDENAFEPYMARFLKAVHTHLAEKGLAGQYIQHIADEPVPKNEASWVYRARRVRQWLHDVPIIDAVMSEGLNGCIDIRVPQIHEVRPVAQRNPNEVMWSYVCLSPQGQYPNRFLDYPSIRNRILFWLSWTLDLKGFLHWGYNYWRPWGEVPVPIDVSPWLDATSGSIYVADRSPLPAGDPHIVYPGKNDICSSIRWEVVRKGIEDYEYLALLEKAVRGLSSRRSHTTSTLVRRGRALLDVVRNEIAAAPDSHTRDDTLLLRTRVEIGDLLERIIGEK